MQIDKRKYSDSREQIKSGDIVAWQGRFTNRRFLKLFNQEIGHTGIAWVVSKRVFVIHALTKGIVINPLSRLTPFVWLATDTDWTEEVQVFALSQLGRSYSYTDALRSFLGMPTIENNGWTCGEYSREILKHAQLPVTQDMPSKLVSEVLALRPDSNLIHLL